MPHVKDMTGQRFGSLVVVKRTPNNHRNLARWLCKCDCGAEKVVNGADLRQGLTKSCGSGIHKIGMNVVDLTGNRYGKLVVIKRAGNAKNGSVKWLCKCDCGNTSEVYRSALQSGLTKSCGCEQLKGILYRNLKHGMRDKRIYRIWCLMKDRCQNPNVPSYKYYGERGISVCEEWNKNFISFLNWAMDNGYSDDLEIDRIDVNGNYEPQNCRWVDETTQANNKRNNIRVTYNGETHTLAEWGRITGLGNNLYRRYRVLGWSFEKAINGDKNS